MIFDNNGQSTDAKSTFSLDSDTYFFSVNEVEILDNSNVGFLERSGTDAKLTGQVGLVKGTTAATLWITNRITFSIGTRQAPITSELKLQTKTVVEEGGVLDLPTHTILERDVELNICGGITNVEGITMRNNGVLKAAYPAHTGTQNSGKWNIDFLSVDYNGVIGTGSCAGHSTTQMTVTLNKFKRAGSVSPNSNYWYLPNVQYEDLTPTGSAYGETYCKTRVNQTTTQNGQTTTQEVSVTALSLSKSQECTLKAQEYTNYETITVETGATLKLEGDSSGSAKTTIRVNTLNIKPGGIVTGVGTGPTAGGTGAGTSASQAGSYGGLGAGVTDTSKLYGSVITPDHYGSSGNSGGRGGGYISIIASEYVVVGECK